MALGYRFGLALKILCLWIISATLIQVRPPGYFTHVSITTPIVSALKNYYA
jgi:hypothetical protein